MGIPTDEIDTIPGVGCAAHFDVDETPKYVYISLSGIAKGTDWHVGLPPAPTGLFKLTHHAGCEWRFVHPDWAVTYLTTAVSSTLIVSLVGDPFALVQFVFVGLETWFEVTRFGSPFDYYTSGFGVMSLTGPSVDWSLSEVALSIGLHPSANLLAEVWPVAGDKSVIRYAQKSDATVVKIKKDLS